MLPEAKKGLLDLVKYMDKDVFNPLVQIQGPGRLQEGDAQLGSWYHYADIFIILSRKSKEGVEGFGLTCVEAGASGTVSVGSSHGGAAEAVSHGLSGSTLDSTKNPARLSLILELADNPKKREKMGQDAKVISPFLMVYLQYKFTGIFPYEKYLWVNFDCILFLIAGNIFLFPAILQQGWETRAAYCPLLFGGILVLFGFKRKSLTLNSVP